MFFTFASTCFFVVCFRIFSLVLSNYLKRILQSESSPLSLGLIITYRCSFGYAVRSREMAWRLIDGYSRENPIPDPSNHNTRLMEEYDSINEYSLFYAPERTHSPGIKLYTITTTKNSRFCYVKSSLSKSLAVPNSGNFSLLMPYPFTWRRYICQQHHRLGSCCTRWLKLPLL